MHTVNEEKVQDESTILPRTVSYPFYEALALMVQTVHVISLHIDKIVKMKLWKR